MPFKYVADYFSCRNLEEKLLNTALSLAEKYEIEIWEVLCANIEFLFADSGYVIICYAFKHSKIGSCINIPGIARKVCLQSHPTGNFLKKHDTIYIGYTFLVYVTSDIFDFDKLPLLLDQGSSFFIDRLKVKEIQEHLVKLDAVSPLKEHHQEFLERMKLYVYPFIAGENHAMLLLLFGLVQQCCGDDAVMEVATVKC